MAESSKTTSKTTKKKATKKKTSRRKKVEPGSRGLGPDEVMDAPPSEVTALVQQVQDDAGQVLATYREPLGGHWTVLAVLPIDKVAPTPFQRDLSATHVKRLTGVIDKLDRFVDPVVTVHNAASGSYWTPNGNHRLHAMKDLGAKSIVALVIPEVSVAYKILALNTEKAHNVKEKSLEVIRMARSLAELDDRPELDFQMEFEEPHLLTLGACYEHKARFSGSAYAPVLKRIEGFLEQPLGQSIAVREARATKLLALDDAVAVAVAALKERGLDSPYLKTFVVARVNPLRFKRGAGGEWDEVIDAMLAAAESFDAGKVRADQVATAAGAPD